MTKLKIDKGLKIHEVKCHPDPFKGVWIGAKTYEVRVNDRDYKVGDLVRLNEYVPEQKKWDGQITEAGHTTGNWILTQIAYVTPGGSWGLPDGLCVFAMRILIRMTKNGEQIKSE